MHSSREFFDGIAKTRAKFAKRNRYYYKDLITFLRYTIEEDANVVELGCGIGTVTSALKNKKKTGIDFSMKMISEAKKHDTKTHYIVDDIESLSHAESYDYILLLDTINSLYDVEKALSDIRIKLCRDRTRLVITYHNFLWEPVLRVGALLGIKAPMPKQSWLSRSDVRALLSLARFEVVTEGERLLLPRYIPILSWFFNAFLAKLPLIRRLCLVQYAIVRPVPYARKEFSVSIVIAVRNEEGNIERAVTSMPRFGLGQEIIFVEGGSKDNTLARAQEIAAKYKNEWDITVVKQHGKGLAAAYHTAFPLAKHDVIMILNGDLTVDPSELLKFYEALASGTGEFINGSRLVYPMEKEAMRFFNKLANSAFGIIFSYLLGQKMKDTLCGMKAFRAADYDRMMSYKKFFGDFDPYGDFELLFSAAKLNHKIIDVPVRYKARTYGAPNISRWSDGVLLLRMCLIAARRMKFW